METKELTIKPEILKLRQNYPLELKIRMSQNRINYWYKKYGGNVYVAFSGGKDSTVLLHMVRSIFPDVPGVFVDTGLEYPEIRSFVKIVPNIVTIKPALRFREVLTKHGYPVISKSVADACNRITSPGTSERTKNKALNGDERGSFGKLPKKWRFLLDAPFKISPRCCEIMKIRPITKYYKATGRASYVGTMAGDSNKRRYAYMKHGCYQELIAIPKCTPMAFWTESDVWDYLETMKVPYCPIYNTGVKHTGCMYCCFGIHLESRPNRFDLMQSTHPILFKYCMDKLGLREVLDFINIGESSDLLP
ncbi:MAG TPA: phosphoadenosine phosphosulfate reductase family protein [Sedimentisphaerales bacterium]|nr:phosphoadenosine phosphosulfate reductase family protein [Sedimentisphaerales bacterium]